MDETIEQTTTTDKPTTTEQPTTEENKNWLEEEAQTVKQKSGEFEELPSLILVENQITSFDVDFSKPFEEWIDSSSSPPVKKKIIPTIHDGVRKNFWLNVKNPLYADLIMAGKDGQKTFKVMRTGQKKDTKYNLVKE